MINLKVFNPYKGLPRNMYILFIATVINRFGDFVMPFLTLYLTVKVGLSAGIAGPIVSLCSIITIPAALLGGRIADKYGRKKTYLIAQFIAASSLLPCAFVADPYVKIACLMSTSFFHGLVRPAMNAIVTDILPPDKRQAGFSLQYLGINVGAALGPLLAGFLFKNLLPLLFIGDALTSFIALYLIGTYVEETHPGRTKQRIFSEEEKEEKEGVLKALIKRPQLSLFFIVYIAYSFIYTQFHFALPLTLENVFSVNSARIFGTLGSINAVTVLVMTAFITSFTKKFHPLANMMFAGITYAIGFGMLGYVKSFPLFILSTIIWTLGEILVVTNFGVYVANNSPSNYRATFSSFGSLSWSIGGALGTSVAGIYIGFRGINTLWNLIIVIALTASVLMAILRKGTRKVGTVHNYSENRQAEIEGK